MILPDIFSFQNCRDYFNDFYSCNKEQDKNFSFANIAKELNWPKSYLSDVINNRKPLTIARATSFIRYFQLDSAPAERLIFMALESAQSGNIQDYFKERLEEPYHLAFKESGLNPIKIHADDETHPNNFFISKDHDDHELIGGAILKLLVRSDGKIKTADIPKKLFSFKELNDPEVLKTQIQKLDRNKNIKIISFDLEGDTIVEILTHNIDYIMSAKTLPQTALYSDNMSRILRDIKVAGNLNFAFINLHRKDYLEVVTRMNQLRAWLLLLDKKSPEDGPPEDFVLFQMEINLAAMMDFRNENLKNLMDWRDKT